MVRKYGRDGNPLELVPARGHEREAERGQRAVIRNVREHPIDTLLDRGTIEAHHHQAAERFLRDWELAQIGSARAVSLETRVDGARSIGGINATQADAFSRVNGALENLGRTGQLIVVGVVVDRLTLDQLTRRMNDLGLQWPPQRFAAPRLRDVLHELASFYGLCTRLPAAVHDLRAIPAA